MAAKHPLTISLTPQLYQFIARRVASGLYGSASEVVREALRCLRERGSATDDAAEDVRAGHTVREPAHAR